MNRTWVMDRIEPPWTPEQVEGLQRWQDSGQFHPYTCAYNGDHGKASLIPTPSGWVCPVETCDYRQYWAHGFSVLSADD